MSVSPGTRACREDDEHEQACCFDERGRLCSRHLRARQPREVGEAMLGETRLCGLEPPQPGVAHPGLDRTCLHVVLPVLRDNRGELTLRRLVSDLAADYPTLELTRFPLEFPPRAENSGSLCGPAFQGRRGNRQGHGDGHEDRCL